MPRERRGCWPDLFFLRKAAESRRPASPLVRQKLVRELFSAFPLEDGRPEDRSVLTFSTNERV